jgi:hypothetical protein
MLLQFVYTTCCHSRFLRNVNVFYLKGQEVELLQMVVDDEGFMYEDRE